MLSPFVAQNLTQISKNASLGLYVTSGLLAALACWFLTNETQGVDLTEVLKTKGNNSCWKQIFICLISNNLFFSWFCFPISILIYFLWWSSTPILWFILFIDLISWIWFYFILINLIPKELHGVELPSIQRKSKSSSSSWKKNNSKRKKEKKRPNRTQKGLQLN